jgi:hypothetical protein
MVGAQKTRMLIGMWTVMTVHEVSDGNEDSIRIGLEATYVTF